MGRNEKTIVVTGASSGLGRAIAELFASKGWTVCGLARRAQRLAELAEQFPDNVETYPTDVSHAAEVKATFAEILEKHACVEVLVNNGGTHNGERFGQCGWEVIDRVINRNLKGPMYCTCAVLPPMIERWQGRIINICSTAGIPGEHVAAPDGVVRFGDYGASKFGVLGFADFMAKELRHFGILMTTLCPGGFDSEIWLRHGRNVYPHGVSNMMRPADVARLVEFIVEQPPSIVFKQAIFFPPCEWH